jgi:hypothetical protein
MNERVEDDTAEILAVSDSLARRDLYGAAQMICRLARERDEARAAIEAMREPTPAMIQAATRQNLPACQVRDVWHTMHAEILK